MPPLLCIQFTIVYQAIASLKTRLVNEPNSFCTKPTFKKNPVYEQSPGRAVFFAALDRERFALFL